MQAHIIIDFMYLYYKYLRSINTGRIRRLTTTAIIETDGVKTEQVIDISKVFYPLSEIEKIRRSTEKLFQAGEVTLSICFDSPSHERKSIDAEYKSNRSDSRLSEEDFSDIDMIRTLLERANYNVYKVPEVEADDIIYNLVRMHSNNFDANIIYTPDTDLMVNIKDNVGIRRYKWTRSKGRKDPYTAISVKNYMQYCVEEFGVAVPYNAIMLYKALCGDKSDKVSGIKGFGPIAFNKFIKYCEDYGISNWQCMNDPNCVANLIQNLGYFSTEAKAEALHSLELVKPMVFDVDAPTNKSSIENRIEAYAPFEMKSLIQ